MRRLIIACLIGYSICVGCTAEAAAKILATRVVDAALQDLKPLLEATLKAPVDIEIATSPVILDRLNNGETADAVLLTQKSVHQLDSAGQITAHTDIAVALLAVAVAAGAPKPVFNSQADFIAFLKSTPSIAYTATGPSGIHMAMLLKRFGLEEAIEPKATIVHEGLTGTLLVQGKVASALQQVSELKSAGATNMVLLPQDIQLRTVITAAILKQSPAPAAAAQILEILKSPAARSAYVRCGVEPL